MDLLNPTGLLAFVLAVNVIAIAVAYVVALVLDIRIKSSITAAYVWSTFTIGGGVALLAMGSYARQESMTMNGHLTSSQVESGLAWSGAAWIAIAAIIAAGAFMISGALSTKTPAVQRSRDNRAARNK